MKEREFEDAIKELDRSDLNEDAQRLLNYLRANIDDVLEAFPNGAWYRCPECGAKWSVMTEDDEIPKTCKYCGVFVHYQECP